MKKFLLIVLPIVALLIVVILFFIFSGGHRDQRAYDDTVKIFKEQADDDGQIIEVLDFNSTIINQNGRSYDLNGLVWINFPSGETQTHEYMMKVSYPPVGSPGFDWTLSEQQ